MKLAEIADQVAADIFTRTIGWQHQSAVVRDACDLATGGDLPLRTLDRLCAMVENRLNGERFWKWRAGQKDLRLSAEAKARGEAHLAVSYERSARQWLGLPRLPRRDS